MAKVNKAEPLQFIYRNWKGKVSTRRVMPMTVEYTNTAYHPENQWMLRAYDIDKGSLRDFAIQDIIEFKGREFDEKA